MCNDPVTRTPSAACATRISCGSTSIRHLKFGDRNLFAPIRPDSCPDFVITSDSCTHSSPVSKSAQLCALRNTVSINPDMLTISPEPCMASMLQNLRLLATQPHPHPALVTREELSVADCSHSEHGQSRISTHLAQLKSAGLVDDRRSGKSVLYACARPAAANPSPSLS